MSLLRDNDDFSIDRFNLELEAERNPELMRRYTKLLAIASAQCKDEKRILDFIEAEQAEIIRSNKEAYGLEKDTDKVVFGLVNENKEYKAQHQKYLAAFRKEQDYKGVVDTIRQRGMMIKILAELWLNNYYSVPTVSKTNQMVENGKLKRRITFEDNSEVPQHVIGDDIPY
jgi:hypothetical protein